jgi:hypothetical protein
MSAVNAEDASKNADAGRGEAELGCLRGMKSMASRLDTSRVDCRTLRRARSSTNDFARAPMAFGK